MQHTKQDIKVPKMYLTLLNQLYEIERKVSNLDDFKKISRNIEKMKDVFRVDIDPVNQDHEIYYEDPMGQKYDETRLDLEAHIVGNNTENLVVIDVVKPIIRLYSRLMSRSHVVQKGIVSVESKNR